MELAEYVCVMSRNWPREELYALTSQIRRAAVSVPSNIAEGQGRMSPKEFLRHLGIARGSLHEVETQAILAYKPGFVDNSVEQRILDLASQIGRLINGLATYLLTKTPK